MAGTIFPYGLRLPTPAYASLIQGNQLPNDVQRAHAAQLYDLSARIRLGLPYPAPNIPGAASGTVRPFDPLHYLYGQQDPRNRFFHEEPKPSYSYIGLIAMAILSSKEKKLILSDIYQWITDNYPYFRTRGTGWRNSIRHNLSLNDCFIKAGRAANGKGHYWAVHQAVVEDFERGDFRRRRAQRKVRKAMGLSVPDEEDSPSPPPPSAEIIEWRKRVLAMNNSPTEETSTSPDNSTLSSQHTIPTLPPSQQQQPPILSPRLTSTPSVSSTSRKRGFDVASLLAPDSDSDNNQSAINSSSDAAIHSSPKRRRLSDDSEVDVDELNDVTTSPSATLNSSESPSSSYPNGSGIPSPVLIPWSRPSAFHSLASSQHATSWRPFLPTGFPLLRGNSPAFPHGFPTARIPLIQPPRIIVPSPRNSRDAEDEDEEDDREERRTPEKE